jgi:hypothetical protein
MVRRRVPQPQRPHRDAAPARPQRRRSDAPRGGAHAQARAAPHPRLRAGRLPCARAHETSIENIPTVGVGFGPATWYGVKRGRRRYLRTRNETVPSPRLRWSSDRASCNPRCGGRLSSRHDLDHRARRNARHSRVRRSQPRATRLAHRRWQRDRLASAAPLRATGRRAALTAALRQAPGSEYGS